MSRQNWDRRAKQRQVIRRINESPVPRTPADWIAPRGVAGWRVEYPVIFPVVTRVKESPMDEIRAIDYNGFTPDDSPWAGVPEVVWADLSGPMYDDLFEVYFADLSGVAA
jgi:hypothetical protein